MTSCAMGGGSEQKTNSDFTNRVAGMFARGKSMRTPRTSSTSAEPQRELAARFPCFATRAPAAAATIAAAVEILNVPLPSPPVPQVSTIFSGGGPGGRKTGRSMLPHDAGKTGKFRGVDEPRDSGLAAMRTISGVSIRPDSSSSIRRFRLRYACNAARMPGFVYQCACCNHRRSLNFNVKFNQLVCAALLDPHVSSKLYCLTKRKF